MRERFLELADKFRLAALAFASFGIVLHIDPAAADPLAPKTFWFATGASLFMALSALRIWWGARFWIPTGPLKWLFLGLPLSALLSFLASRRYAGVESAFNAWILLSLLIPCVYDLMQEEHRRRLLVQLLAVCLGIAVLRGLLQLARIDLDPSDALARAQFRWRLSASFGNPNFYAGFLVLLLPLALWLAMEVHLGFLALAALAGLMAVAAGSKAGLLALSFLYLAFGHLGWHSDLPLEARKKFLRIWALAGLTCVLASAALMRQVFVARYVDTQSYRQSAAFRMQTWEGAFQAFKAAPLLGHGPGSFSAVYPAFRLPEAMQSQVQHSYEVTHPENWLLQLLVEQGLLGLLAFAAFAGMLLWALWKRGHGLAGDAQGAPAGAGRLAACLFLGLASSLACNLASLDLFLPSTFWFAALLCALALRQATPSSTALRIQTGSLMAAMVSALIFLLCLSPMMQARAKWGASRKLQEAKAFSSGGAFAQAETPYKLSLELDPLNAEANYFNALNQLDLGRPKEALAGFEALQKLAPDFVLVHDKKAKALRSLGKINEAAAEWERQLALDPWHLESVKELATLYAGTGRLKDAARVLEGAAARFPENKELNLNLEKIRRSLRG